MRIGHHEMSVPFDGNRTSVVQNVVQTESQIITKTKTVSTLDHSAIPLWSGIVAK